MEQQMARARFLVRQRIDGVAEAVRLRCLDRSNLAGLDRGFNWLIPDAVPVLNWSPRQRAWSSVVRLAVRGAMIALNSCLQGASHDDRSLVRNSDGSGPTDSLPVRIIAVCCVLTGPCPTLRPSRPESEEGLRTAWPGSQRETPRRRPYSWL